MKKSLFVLVIVILIQFVVVSQTWSDDNYRIYTSDIEDVVRFGYVSTKNTANDITPLGTRVFFSGGRSAVDWNSDNSDSIYFQRVNVASDQTTFRLNIGDYGDYRDTFTIGSTWTGGVFTDRFIFKMNGDLLVPFGKIGVGTDNPQKLFHIKSEGETLILEGTAHTYMAFYPQGYSSGRKGFFGFSSTNSKDIVLYNENTDGSLRFYTNQSQSMQIASSGNVGIGISDPTHKLSVNGTIAATEIMVTNNITTAEIIVTDTDWADFVFEESYQLRSLDEVRSHINEYGYLPDMPSAEQVQEEGVGLAEMNTKLLQKIEELTLYVMDLQEQINELKSGE